MFSYEFYLAGSIRVSIRALGYIQAAYYAHNADYRYQIHDALSGSMHDHVLNYKADSDILGLENKMQMTTFTPVTEKYTWSDHPRTTMKIQREFVENENTSRLNWGGNGDMQFRIVNTICSVPRMDNGLARHPLSTNHILTIHVLRWKVGPHIRICYS